MGAIFYGGPGVFPGETRAALRARWPAAVAVSYEVGVEEPRGFRGADHVFPCLDGICLYAVRESRGGPAGSLVRVGCYVMPGTPAAFYLLGHPGPAAELGRLGYRRALDLGGLTPADLVGSFADPFGFRHHLFRPGAVGVPG